MLSALLSTSGAHTHCAWPPLQSGWCAQCSAMTDWAIRFLDTVYAREGVTR
jgi:hypothetical protein